ncbi:S8 family serine peptidase [bacterium]|nr:S8 family serine peptidase [candidate division CSSED10-310 bacterium]
MSICLYPGELAGVDAGELAALLDRHARHHGAAILVTGVLPLSARQPGAGTPADIDPALVRFLRLRTDLDMTSAGRLLARHDGIRWACPLYRRHFTHIPNDPGFDQQWSLRNHGQQDGLPGADISATAAWDRTRSARQVVAAVVDSGVDYMHEELTPAMRINQVELNTIGADDDGNGFIDDWLGWDFVENDNDPRDDFGHGTHVTGIIAAAMDNGAGIAGIAPDISILPIRIGGLFGFYDDAAAQGIVYACDNGADSINASWGAYYRSELIELVMAYAAWRGVLVVAAAGNDNTDRPHYPAAIDTVLCVAATDRNDKRAMFTSPKASNLGSWIDLCAPGGDIYSTVINGGFASKSGTSMAAPHVTGTAALVLAVRPTIVMEELAARLVSTCDSLYRTNPGDYLVLGSGRLDAYAAVTETPRPALRPLDIQVRETAGDGDQHPESGEALDLEIELIDTWRSTGILRMSLTSRSPYLLVGDGRTDLEGFDAQERRWLPSRFIEVAADCPDDHLAELVLNLRETTGAYQCDIEFSLVLNDGHPAQIGWPWTSGGELDGSVGLVRMGPVRHGVVVGGEDRRLSMLTGSGVVLPGWPVELRGKMIASPATGDLDGDGIEDIVAGDLDGMLYAFRQDGTSLPGWPVITGGHGAPTSTLLVDFDGDGCMEVVDATWSATVWVISGDGSILPGWPAATRGGVNSCPAVGDMNRDGSLDIIVADKAGYLHVWNLAGEPLPPWPIAAGTSYISSPLVLDLDHDGDLEILAADLTGTVQALHHDGLPVYGWPRRLENPVTASPARHVAADGGIHLVVTCDNGLLHLLDHAGSDYPGFPAALNGDVISSPLVMDLDGHPGLEICQVAGQSLHALHLDGTSVEGWPCELESDVHGTPGSADLDGDGDLELVITALSGKVITLDIPGEGDAQQRDWRQFRGDGARHGGWTEVTSEPAVRMAGILPAIDHPDRWSIYALVADGGGDVAHVAAASTGLGRILLHERGDSLSGLFEALLPDDWTANETMDITIQAMDHGHRVSAVWPYIDVSGAHPVSWSPPGPAPPSGEYDADGPAILAAGFDLSRLDAENGGGLTILAYPVSPVGDEIAQVELYQEDAATGMLLYDDGGHGDWRSGDGVYGIQILLPPDAVAPGSYRIQIRAVDIHARGGLLWPRLPGGTSRTWKPKQ